MKDKTEIQDLLNLGLIKHQQGNLNDAEKIYVKILKNKSDHSIVLYLLGTLKAQQNRDKEAIDLIQQSIKYNAKNADAYYNLGNIFQKIKGDSKAIFNYQNAVRLNPKYFKAHYNLGKIYFEDKKYKESLIEYKRALKINPNYIDAIINIGTLFVTIKNLKEAEKFFKQGISINQNNSKLYYNYATVLQELEKYENAAFNYKKAIEIEQNYPRAYNNLGLVYKKLNKFSDSLLCFKKAIDQDPNYALAYNNLGNIYDTMCKHESAIKTYKKAIELDSKKLATRWALMNTFPVIYSDKKDIQKYKKKFSNDIKSINSFIDKNKQLSKKNITDGLLNSANFYLHYQGENNISDQKKYAKLIEKLTFRLYPDKFVKIKQRKNSKRIKVGFISSTCFNDHSVSSVIRNLILKINNKKFEVFIYKLNKDDDEITSLFQKKFKNFICNQNIDQIIKIITLNKLDFLIYTDIGMDPKMQLLGSLRLAPVQCQTFAHPVSSCLENIDYFLSSDLMENKKSKKQYNEKLYNLSNTGQCFEFPKIKLIKNKVNNSKTIFFNLQNLFKLLPNDDDLCLDLIKKIKNCEIWFIEGKNTTVTELFKKRLKNKFEKNNLNFEKNIIFHKRLSQSDFFKLINKSDIILDSLNWSGNVTTHQAIYLNKPVITLPGKYMRSRHTFALLSYIKLNETIAKTKKDYINIAYNLSENFDYRKKIIRKIKLNKIKLFNDIAPVKSLEKFLITISAK